MSSSANIPESHHPKPEGLVTKVVKSVCCRGQQLCRDYCDCCWPTEPVKRIQKEDIQRIIQHQPASRLDSFTSQASQASSSISQFSFSAQSSPSYFSRERNDSESTSSRKGSTSSNSEYKRSNPTPVIDMKPIEFWANRETVQPRSLKRRLPSESEISIEDFKPDLYEQHEDSEECLTDEEKLARFKLGQIHFSLQYEIPTKCLIVRIIEAKELPLPFAHDTSRQDMAHSNPYAKVCLLPDQKNSQQTAVQRKTQEPTWGEIFRFELPFKEAQRRTLEITVKDFDRYSRHCVIGQIHLTLDTVNLIKGGHMWKPLLPSNKEQPDLGEILLSLNYLPSAGRLNVDVIKAKQLQQTDLIGGSDPFVKISLFQGEKTVKTKKTSIKKNTIDPVFNESVSFNVTADQLDQCSLVVTVWDHNSKCKDDLVGRIVMGRQATGPYEVTHWNRMIQCQRSPVAQWHTLRTRNECDAKCSISATAS